MNAVTVELSRAPTRTSTLMTPGVIRVRVLVAGITYPPRGGDYISALWRISNPGATLSCGGINIQHLQCWAATIMCGRGNNFPLPMAAVKLLPPPASTVFTPGVKTVHAGGVL